MWGKPRHLPSFLQMISPDGPWHVWSGSWFHTRVTAPRRFVYILKSVDAPAHYYGGVTSDPRARLEAHNAGLSPHTAGHRPWRTLVAIEFDEEEPAIKFERYLKTGSGRESETTSSMVRPLASPSCTSISSSLTAERRSRMCFTTPYWSGPAIFPSSKIALSISKG
jgi:putative endonuclease